MGPTSKGMGGEVRESEGKGGEKGERESPQSHFLDTPLRGGIEGQGWERGGRKGGSTGGCCLQFVGGVHRPCKRMKG